MRLASGRRSRQAGLPGVTGVAKLDHRTKNLTKRLKPGQIAIVDHADIDRVSAEALVSGRAAAVVNAAISTSGRYPNLGPEILLAAGIPIIDGVGQEIFERVRDGDRLRVFGGDVFRGADRIATGTALTADLISAQMAEARAGMSEQLEAFAENTMDYLRRERDLLFDGIGIPELRTPIDGRHVLIVVRGYNYRTDLSALRPYIREYRPILMGVDGGADALLDAGYRPDIVVGDMDSISEKALRSSKEIVVHAYADGQAPGLKRVVDLGLEAVVCPAAGTSEDVAMLLADECGATLIVAVGSHATLIEFLDKGRAGMASTFLTRLRVGGKLVDAKGVSRLYRSRIQTRSLVLLVLAALVTIATAVSISPAGQLSARLFASTWSDFARWLGHLAR
ncbi:MAG: putative cytokinetic ring protein SteA [Actinomycetota bacterium]